MSIEGFTTLSHVLAWYRNKDYIRLGILNAQNANFQIEVIAENLQVPWAVDISEDGRLFFTERNGKLRVIENGTLNTEPVYTFGPPFVSTGEGGLLGLALDRDFLINGAIYLMYTYEDGGKLYSRVVRLSIVNNLASGEEIILDRIPAGQVHNGGRLKIGPDGYLYITVGDGGDRDLAQDMNSLAGKILRIGTDGSIPSDNPYPDSPVYALGFRNPQGLAWNDRNMLYVSEHGETAHDEINIIQPGGNYGWPFVTGEEVIQGYDIIKPVIQSGNDTWAPSGIAFVSAGPRKGQLFVSTLRGSVLLAVTLDESGTQAVQVERLLQGRYGRLREAYQAKDGSMYLTTSNTDGRGLVSPGDDKILRLLPVIQ
ncbi:PQQ-dependent sugar dehydrogenase [Anaerocolumna sp. MB42-C2]|uniref:PQQ-dependent sugar dehydrogenase n=1 Tax=Anaerocolumna sp. MB42-C2 TaxID=3070997 RepID=UPI0027DF8EA2|nr:PQQ-dependent sugar dehydrogenase [Anaerocolumna sp. MB42-C2]WMJ86019.1 PQQ-dependent sugar dehydrogenase [Anaerocolumna sp. MB42-C2]